MYKSSIIPKQLFLQLWANLNYTMSIKSKGSILKQISNNKTKKTYE
jgi:hypothetical protein